jgi:hypothetical protein
MGNITAENSFRLAEPAASPRWPQPSVPEGTVMTRLPRDRLAALRPEDVQQYLRSRGWLLDSSGTSDKAVSYHYPGQADAEVLVPR